MIQDNINPATAQAFLAALAAIEHQLARIADHLVGDSAPDYQKPIEAFAGFDWSEIDAVVVKRDDYGPAVVEWNGRAYTRRSPQNKFGAAIWFSRSVGKDADGNVVYQRLITFKPLSAVEPLSREAEHLAAANGHKPAPVPAPVPAPPASQPARRQQPPAPQPPAPQQSVAEILASLDAIEQEKRSHFPPNVPASDRQYGLWCGLVGGVIGDAGRRSLTAALAGVEPEQVADKAWRPPQPRCAAWLSWLVVVEDTGNTQKPNRYVLGPGRKEDLIRLHQELASLQTPADDDLFPEDEDDLPF